MTDKAARKTHRRRGVNFGKFAPLGQSPTLISQSLTLTLTLALSLTCFAAPAIAQDAPAPPMNTGMPDLPVGPVGPQLEEPCERACLKGFVDRYLEALIAHDPARLPLTDDVRFSENTIQLNLGEALWQTASGLGEKRVYLADPYSDHAGFFGTILENGEPRMLAVRLKIRNHEISEIETIVTRAGLLGPFEDGMEELLANPIWAQPLTSDESVPRAEMVRAADLYFDGMDQNTGSIVPFSDQCNRTENGLQTTNNPNLPEMGGVNIGAMGCLEQFDLMGVGIYSTPERRFWMVDEERGIVFGMFMFTIKQQLSVVPIAEAFKIKNGEIYEIEAVGVSGGPLPYGSRSGW